MRRSRYLFWSALFVVLIVFVRPDGLTAYADRNPRVALDQDDIGGVVTSAKGPEAGVWLRAAGADRGFEPDRGALPRRAPLARGPAQRAK